MSVADYTFMKIGDAVSCINQRVNLIGVAVDTTLPKSTKGTDCFCAVRIIDESLPSGIHIHFFAPTMEDLPAIENVGDIVLVYQVVISTRPDGVYAMFNKKFSSFALFEGRGSSIKELVPYQISARYEPREKDKKVIVGLRKCSFGERIIGLYKTFFLREIKEGEHFNVVCKILHTAQVKEDEWMLFIWDGSDTQPVSVEAKYEDEMQNPLPLMLEPAPLSRDILCTFPVVGTVLRMVIDQGQEKLGIKFIKLLTPTSKLCYLPDDDYSVMNRQRIYKERVSTQNGRMPFTCLYWPSSITETSHPDANLVTLMDVLTYPEVTYKFKCLVRVVALVPWRPEDFHSPSGVYRLQLTLEDPTARIHAFLFDKDGDKFFENCESVDALTKIRDVLLGVNRDPTGEYVTRDPPWIQCCLKSYYIDSNDVWGSRIFGIFDTTCIC
ncbi:protection of telomeres protein 1a-like isoform X2 [Salvia hispanica]|uniref:protection of telomeres protein 1a-like isoform X2 n=1 Tax=Salvia hispanica TaxID=49212 RepID=UPI002009522F|nr:protection of telomeres protein 1a-like isoform X2 [Salvia hispanica]